MEFRETIRQYREREGWTKKKLAELVGVTQPYIVQIENDGKVPSDAVVLRLADCLGVDRRELLFAAYRARAPKDLKECFASVFDDDFVPGRSFDQPFVLSRGNHIESPDFIIRDLGTSVGGGFHISLIQAKSDDAFFEEHQHRVPTTLVVAEGIFTVARESGETELSLDGQVCMTLPAGAMHSVRALKKGKLISIALGQGATRAAASLRDQVTDKVH
jgi:transcriptional regulator with XRE-family HTH domain